MKNQTNKFPLVFDTMFDLKSESEAINRLKKIKENIDELKRQYSSLHRMLREHGYKPEPPHEIK
jgi:hypothetical protein